MCKENKICHEEHSYSHEHKEENTCCKGHNHKHGHSHNHGHHHHHHSTSVKNIKIAFFLNFFFSIFEIIGGILTNSSAILSDAIHDFGDSLSLGLALIFEKKSNKEADKVFTYGYKRLSVISAIINILVLSIGTLVVLKESIERLLSPQPIAAKGMLLFAILGIAINGLSVLRMKSSVKISEKAVMLHLLEDLFGWIAVLVVSIVVLFTDLYILDPILSLIICFIMLRNIYYNIISIYKIIMQAIPDNINISDIENEISNNLNNVDVKTLKIWSLDGESSIASVVISIEHLNTTQDVTNIKKQLKEILLNYNVIESTIEIL